MVEGLRGGRQLNIIFKASEHGRNSINEIPPPSKLRA